MTESNKIALAAGMEICRLVNGMWQVSGAHGKIDAAAAIESMFAYIDAGLTSWDLADHYGPAEDFVGALRATLNASGDRERLAQLQFFTKWVPRPILMTNKIVNDAINRSLRRMETDALDLLQFHWWEYRDDGYLRALEILAELQDEGKIRHLGLTNFDTEHLNLILAHGIKIVSNQVQYSLIDLRPEVSMAEFCREHKVSLLTYGSLCGGLISEKYLAKPEPGNADLNTASLRKYKQMIDAWGGWQLFQELLVTLAQIAEKHTVSIANVALRYILDRPAVASVIVGARLSLSEHIADNLRVFELTMDDEDRDQIQSVLKRSNDLFQLIGDCGDEYRR